MDNKQKSLLKDKAGEDAISLAQNNDLSWRCVCGYFNDKNSNVCGNCERSKTEVLEKYSDINIFIQNDQKSDLIYQEMVEDTLENQEKSDLDNAFKVDQPTMEAQGKNKPKKDKLKKEKSNQIVDKIKKIILKFNFFEKKTKLLLSCSFILLLVSIVIWVLFR